jgi:putative endonuclease
MAGKIDMGRLGEDYAFNYLITKGYKIQFRNWRMAHYELDIVAIHNNQLVIVEVKTRSAAIYETNEDAITPNKIRFLVNATEAYILEHDIQMETRFDVIFIKWFSEGKYELDHIENAFTSPVN